MGTTPRYHNAPTQTETTLFVEGNTFDLTTAEGRMAARAYAFMVGAQGDEQTKREIMKRVGRDDG